MNTENRIDRRNENRKKMRNDFDEILVNSPPPPLPQHHHPPTPLPPYKIHL